MKPINQFILEKLETVNESVASGIVRGWIEQCKRDWNYNILMRSYQWDKIEDSDLVWHDQSEAKKLAYKRNDTYVLFWVNDKDQLIAMTAANYSWFLFSSAGLYERGMRNIMPIVREAKGAYSIDDKFSAKALRDERAQAKSNALALMDNEKVKEQNLARYAKIIKENSLKDGSMYTGIKARFDDITQRYKDLFEEIGSASEADFPQKMQELKNISQYYTNAIFKLAEVLKDYEREKNGSPWTNIEYNLKELDKAITKYNSLFKSE